MSATSDNRWIRSNAMPSTPKRRELISQACAIARETFKINLKSWQSEAIAHIFENRDVVVSAGTGSGKSMVFQCLPFMRPAGIVLVISPLLSLMHDQVSELVGRGISAIALTTEALHERPGLWAEVESGKYRLVYRSPELLLRTGGYFLRQLLRKRCAFIRDLVALAVDEVHVVWGYRQFRGEYGNIGDLRAHIRKVPVVSLFATLTATVLNYIHKALHLSTPTVLYRLPVGRSNVTIVVAPQAPESLNFVVDHTIDVSWMIPKTFIFVDEVDLAVDIARKLRELLHPTLHAKGREIIKVMTASLDPGTRSRCMEGLRNGSHRIVVGTEVIAMGLNFPDVDVIVQYGIADHLTLASVWQRIGRAARDPKRQALTVIFTPENYLLPIENDDKPNSEGWYYGYRQPAEVSRRDNVAELTARMYSYTGVPRSPCDKIDPALIFLLNTSGCRWRAGLVCFQDQSWLDGTNLAQIPGNPEDPTYCCDDCYFNRMETNEHQYPCAAFILHNFDIRRSTRYRQTSAYSEEQLAALYQVNIAAEKRSAKALSSVQVSMTRDALVEWRNVEVQSVRILYPYLMMCDFLSNTSIEKLSSSIHQISCADDIQGVLLPEVNAGDSVLCGSLQSLWSCLCISRIAIGPPVYPRQYTRNEEVRETRARKKSSKQLLDRQTVAFNTKARNLNIPLRETRRAPVGAGPREVAGGDDPDSDEEPFRSALSPAATPPVIPMIPAQAVTARRRGRPPKSQVAAGGGW